MPNTLTLEKLFQNLWQDYCAFNPQAQRVYELLVARGEKVVNDHIALRTFQHPKLGIAHLAKTFEDFGYVAKSDYVFKEKKLLAKYWEHPNPENPKVFISELEVKKMSPSAQKIIDELIDQAPNQMLMRKDVAMGGRPWNLSSHEFETLSQESEYAGWLAAHGFRPNHFTVFFNYLKTFKDLRELNQFLRSQGYRLNESGGEIKGTPAELLEQSSTLSEETEVRFTDGTKKVPACYYEFARRYKDPKTGQLYSGFIAASADKIFESTNRG